MVTLRADVVEIRYFGELHLIVLHVVIPGANKIINFVKFMMTRDLPEWSTRMVYPNGLPEWSWEQTQLDSIEGIIILKYALKYLL